MQSNSKTRVIRGSLVGLLVVLILLLGVSYWQLASKAGMDPGLKIKALHKSGIDGTGVSVAIIDQKLLTTHKEYTSQLKRYTEMGNVADEPNSMHGSAVASILVGKNCGVAPGADLYYWAVAVNGAEPVGVRYAQAIRDVVEFNDSLSPAEQIKIISISTGFREHDGGDEFAAAIQEAQAAGMLVFTSSYPYFTDPILAAYNAALVKSGSRDNYHDYGVQPEVVEYLGQPADVIVSERHERSIEAGYIPIWVPVEPRTLASWRGESKYELYDVGGDSWATPYIAGVAALLMQVNPGLTNKQIVECLANTVTENKHGLLMISPEQAVAAAQDFQN